MRTIGAAEFKAHCLKILDEVGPEGIVITKRGKPVAMLIPPEASFDDLYGRYRERIAVEGDLLSSDREWDART